VRTAAAAVVLLGLLAVPFVGGEGYVTHVGITLLISAILASSLNLLMGYTGLVSIAHAAFFGVGAYTSGVLVIKAGFSFWLALLAATAVTGVIALGIGLPSFRTRGVYYIIVTVAFQLIASEVFDNWYELTGGGLGLRGIPRPAPIHLGAATIAFTSKVPFYYLVLGVAVLVHALIIGLLRSPIGMALMAVRDNETKARMLGVNPLRYKTFAFVLASALAGLAGSLSAHYLEYAHPDFFGFGVSVDLFLAVMLGGAGTLWGPVFGVVLLEVLREALQEFAAVRLFLFGVLLVVLISFLPEGLLRPLGRLGRRLARAPARS
jgi:branched-chain amino acid transport system permease protein